mmetsp:Transcript_67592/g.171563  ORF Transcript_67592/g.171563 Transcript_67592/m.171563 type:complete len:289 (-) Transcript_67592:130-996(-)
MPSWGYTMSGASSSSSSSSSSPGSGEFGASSLETGSNFLRFLRTTDKSAFSFIHFGCSTTNVRCRRSRKCWTTSSIWWYWKWPPSWFWLLKPTFAPSMMTSYGSCSRIQRWKARKPRLQPLSFASFAVQAKSSFSSAAEIRKACRLLPVRLQSPSGSTLVQPTRQLPPHSSGKPSRCGGSAPRSSATFCTPKEKAISSTRGGSEGNGRSSNICRSTSRCRSSLPLRPRSMAAYSVSWGSKPISLSLAQTPSQVSRSPMEPACAKIGVKFRSFGFMPACRASSTSDRAR